MEDDTTTGDSTLSATQRSSSQNRDRAKDVEAPKLRGNRAEEYHRWRRYVNWWIEDTRIPSRRRAVHLIMHCIVDSDVAETVHGMTDAEINCEEGIHNLMETLDEYFLANSESKLFNLWRQMRKWEKTPDITWDQYLKKQRKIFGDLEKYGLKLDDKITCVAMIDGTNLDQNTKLHIESVARNQSEDKKLHPKFVDEAIRRMVSDENTTEVLEVAQEGDDNDAKEEDENETLWLRQYRGRPGRSRFNQKSSRSGYRGRYPSNSRDKLRCHNCGSDKHFVRFCDKPIKQQQNQAQSLNQFTGVVQNAE